MAVTEISLAQTSSVTSLKSSDSLKINGFIKEKQTKEAFQNATVALFINGKLEQDCTSDSLGFFSMLHVTKSSKDTVFELRAIAVGRYIEQIKNIAVADLLKGRIFYIELRRDTMLEMGRDPMPVTKYAIPPVPKISK